MIIEILGLNEEECLSPHREQYCRLGLPCCVNGLVMADKRVVLRETDTKGVCADWYYIVDTFAAVAMALLRGTQSQSLMYNFFGRCVMK